MNMLVFCGRLKKFKVIFFKGWSEISERYFSEKMWPDERVVEQIVGSESRLFIILYKELYYRDLYTRMSRKYITVTNVKTTIKHFQVVHLLHIVMIHI